MSRRAVLSRSPGQTRLATVDGDRLTDIWIERDHAPGLVGRYFSARVTSLQRAMGGAFVDLGGGRSAYVRSIRRSGGLSEGQRLLVQITQDAAGGKLPVASLLPVVTGPSLVFDPAGSDVRLSRRVTGAATRKAALAMLRRLAADGDGGLIGRIGVGGVGEELLSQECRTLRERWHSVQKQHETSKETGEIAAGLSQTERFLIDNWATGFGHIALDAPFLQDAARAAAARFPVFDTAELDFHRAPEPLFEASGLEEQVEALAEPVVSIPGGARLTVEETAAATLVDVDSASANPKSTGKAFFEAVNRDAIPEIASQIRLRNLGGIVILDLAAATVHPPSRDVVDRLKAATRADPLPVRIAGVTPLGLIEMTRRRARPPISQVLCGDGGKAPVLSSDTLALQALQRAHDAIRRPSAPTRLKLLVPPAIGARIRGQDLSEAWMELQNATGNAITLVDEPSMEREQFDLIVES